MTKRLKVLAIGKSGRLDCIVDGIHRSRHPTEIYVLSEVNNPSLRAKTVEIVKDKTDDLRTVQQFASRIQPDLAVIGPEEPLAAGVVDCLEQLGIRCVGPTRRLAQVESSKAFARRLLAKYNIPGNPRHRAFHSLNGVEDYLYEIGAFVVKPDGLTGGKGVKVLGEHLLSIREGFAYCKELFASGHSTVVIEERLEGEEFSLQAFCDGRHVVNTIPVQDHKRAYDGDQGPNTGGMGSYSCADHSLPFLTARELNDAAQINQRVAMALMQETGEAYRGILYGAFILTKDGVRVIEYNARFGDPEVMNILPIMENDLMDVFLAMINGALDQMTITFQRKATVCKYVVPVGYPGAGVRAEPVDLTDLPAATSHLRIFHAAIDIDKKGETCLTGSRALALVGIGDSLEEAEAIAEDAAKRVRGPVFHREDIGTGSLIAKRVRHMQELRTMNRPFEASIVHAV